MRFEQCKIIQFAKAPLLGQVKTRLMPALTAQQALDLHRALVRHTLKRLIKARIAPVELWVSRPHAWFEELVADLDCPIQQQQGAVLGARMSHAMRDSLDAAECAIIVGSDCPLLDADVVASAIEDLQQGTPVVIGPADDGGYVLIGMRRHLPELFVNVNWGSAEVLAQTRQRCEALQIDWRELPSLWDIDRPDDLQRLRDLLRQSPQDYPDLRSLTF